MTSAVAPGASLRRAVAADVAIWAREAGCEPGWGFALRHLWARPGFHFVLGHRLARRLRSVPLVGRPAFRVALLLLEIFYACEFGAEADLGDGLYIPHPFGIVIGNGARLGAGVTVLQNVTLGRRGRGAGPRPMPMIERDVLIGAGAVVLGGVTIGRGATVAANALVLCDVPAGATAIGNPATIAARASP